MNLLKKYTLHSHLRLNKTTTINFLSRLLNINNFDMNKYFLKYSFLTFLIAFSLNANAQLVKLGFPLNPGESKYYSVVTACNSGNDLWAVFQIYDTTVNGYCTKICKNNGLFWTEYIKFRSNVGNGTTMNSTFYNGDLYFNANFSNLTLNSVTYPSMNAILKWDGTSLVFIDSIRGEIMDMDTFNNKLIIAGNFSKVGTNLISKLAEYDGSSWSALGTPADWVNFQPGSGNNNKLGQLVNQGNKLFITGATAFIDGTKPRYYGLAIYDGSTISPVVNTEFTYTNFFYGQIYAHPDSSKYYANDSFYRTFYCENGQNSIKVNNIQSGYARGLLYKEKFAYRGNSIFTLKAGVALNQFVNYAFIEKFTGNNIKKIMLPSKYLLVKDKSLGIFGKDVVFLMLYTIDSEQDFYRLDSNENLTATVTGRVFIDYNLNNIFDGNDKPVRYNAIIANPGNIKVLSDNQGYYTLPGLDSGRYTFEMEKPKNKLFSKPSNGKYIDSLSLDSNVIRNFAFTVDSTIKDIEVSLTSYWGWRARRGFTETYYLKIRNNSMYTKSGTVSLNYDGVFLDPVSYDSSLKFNNGTGTFTYTGLEVEEEILVSFALKTSTSVSTGTTHKLWCSLDSTIRSWDNDSSNDIDTLYVRISAAYDPNDKTSRPEGDIKPGTRHVQYHINFQNVGDDTAYNVVVVDTLDMRLPLEKIVLGSSSHPYKLRTVDNILIFEFKNIKLVDSSTNEPKSKGFIRFSAQLEPNLPIGAKVDNRAHIYFDYNEAIITNTASLRIADNTESIDENINTYNTLSVYPNPSSDLIKIINSLDKATYSIYSISGAIIQSGEVENGENTLNVSGLSPGIYFIVLSNGLNAKIIIQ